MSTAEIDASWHGILIVALHGEIKCDASGVYVLIKKIKYSAFFKKNFYSLVNVFSAKRKSFIREKLHAWENDLIRERNIRDISTVDSSGEWHETRQQRAILLQFPQYTIIAEIQIVRKRNCINCPAKGRHLSWALALCSTMHRITCGRDKSDMFANWNKAIGITG